MHDVHSMYDYDDEYGNTVPVTILYQLFSTCRLSENMLEARSAERPPDESRLSAQSLCTIQESIYDISDRQKCITCAVRNKPKVVSPSTRKGSPHRVRTRCPRLARCGVLRAAHRPLASPPSFKHVPTISFPQPSSYNTPGHQVLSQ